MWTFLGIKKHHYSIILFLFHVGSAFSTEKVTGTLNHQLPKTKIYLWETLGEKSYLIDSTQTTAEKYFSFDTGELPTGFYHIGLHDTNRVSIILNRKEEVLNIVFSEEKLGNALIVFQSNENKALWDYKYFSKTLNQELKILEQLMNSPVVGNEEMRQALLNKIDSLNWIKSQKKRQVQEQNKGSYLEKVMSLSHYDRNPDSSYAYQQQHFFDSINFNDPSLIRSTALVDNVMEYLYRYTSYDEVGFRTSVDKILDLSSVNDQVYEFNLNYLLELFNRVGPDIIFQYIVEQYILNEGCSDANISEEIQNITDGYRAVMIGKQAPPFSIKDTSNKEVYLEELLNKKEETILFFWSSHCSFCHEAIPSLMEWVTKYDKKVQVVAISLDNERGQWINYIQEHRLPWINLSELKGWESAIAKQYKVHRTPSFFVLNKKGKIISKPTEIKEITTTELGPQIKKN